MAMDEERHLRIRIAARPPESRYSWSSGKKAFVNAWTQADIFLSEVRAKAKPTTRPDRNFGVLYIHETETKRKLGVFAGFSLPKGHRIICERPAFSCIQWKGKKTAKEEWLKLSLQQRLEMRVWFRKLRTLALGGTDTFTKSDKKQLEAFVSDYAFWDPQRAKAHIYRLTSHINHACRSCANAELWVDSEDPNKINVKLVRDVEKDGEIFIFYNKKKLPFGCALCPEGRTLCGRIRAFIDDFGARRPAPRADEGDSTSDDGSKTASRKPSLPDSSYSEKTLVDS
ncbi:hypothetical protein NLG97_g2773 [Lecanicillium saksenae]|uniref:Uncharacterized protein n=1 Tax=Lecanicillium saksenae TaxID=468837 RepID=A0ACC1R2M6_9HYPO|nr:hypothetical protein NLG97_g2773 [Lecanicillium saksenae]